MTSLLLALSGAALYGVSDFLGGLASRRTSPWAVAMVSAFAAAVLVLLASFFVEGSPDATSLWWAALAGVGNGFGTSFLYRGLSSGRMGVVAPISAVGAAVVPVAAGLAGGERPGLVVWLGILMALPGIWFVSREPRVTEAPSRGGVGDGVLAGLGFGTLFAALGQIPESAGLLPLAFNQVVAGVVIVAVALALRVEWLPRERTALIGAVVRGPGRGRDRRLPDRHPAGRADHHRRAGLALPGVHDPARGLGAARAHPPGPGARPGPVRPRGGSRSRRLSIGGSRFCPGRRRV